MRKQLDDARTPGGALLAAKARLFMQTFKPLVDPQRPDAEPAAAAQTILVERALADRIERMRADNKNPGDLFDASKPVYIRTPFELVPGLVPHGPEGEQPRCGPTEPGRVGEGPQTTDSPPQPDTAAPTGAPLPEDGGPGPSELAPQELPPINVWPDSAAGSAASPDRSPAAGASVTETPSSQPPPTRDQAPDHEGSEAAEPAPDVGYIESGIGNALKAIGIEPGKAEDAAAAIALVASLHPVVGVPLALDDLQVAIRRHDIPGILLAAAGFIPGVRAGRGVAKVLLRKRELDALASLQTARRRLVSANLDRLTAKRDAGKIDAAVRRGSARRINSEVGFNRFRTFKNNLGHAPPGHQWHHIVNYHPTNIRQFGFHALNSSSNLILLPTEVQRKVSAAYSSSKIAGVKGLTLRDWLKPRSFDEQHRHGVMLVQEILRDHYRVPR